MTVVKKSDSSEKSDSSDSGESIENSHSSDSSDISDIRDQKTFFTLKTFLSKTFLFTIFLFLTKNLFFFSKKKISFTKNLLLTNNFVHQIFVLYQKKISPLFFTKKNIFTKKKLLSEINFFSPHISDNINSDSSDSSNSDISDSSSSIGRNSRIPILYFFTPCPVSPGRKTSPLAQAPTPALVRAQPGWDF